MKKENVPQPASPYIINRLTALWGLNEAGLGGIMHAIKSPFTGIFVGGIAIILIAMIAYHADNKIKAILKATSIVLIIKALASPHAPFPAYLAVGFQGIMGAALFGIIPSYRLAALILGIIGLTESALQKIIAVTLIYGNSLWESIDLFSNSIFQEFGLTTSGQNFHISIILISLYLGLYLLAGFVIGYLAGSMPAELKRTLTQHTEILSQKLSVLNQSAWPAVVTPRPFWKRTAFRISVVLVAIMIILTVLNPQVKGISQAIYVLIRTCVIISFWYFAAAPLLNKLLTRFLSRKKQKYTSEVEQIVFLLPHLRGAAVIIWNDSAQFHLLRRLKYFLLTLIAYALTSQPLEKENEQNVQKPVSTIEK